MMPFAESTNIRLFVVGIVPDVSYLPERYRLLADAIVARLEQLGMSQADLCAASGLAQPTVQGFMQGKPRAKSPRPKTLIRLSLGLRLPPTWAHELLSGHGVMPPVEWATKSEVDELRADVAALRSLLDVAIARLEGRPPTEPAEGAPSSAGARHAAPPPQPSSREQDLQPTRPSGDSTKGV